MYKEKCVKALESRARIPDMAAIENWLMICENMNQILDVDRCMMAIWLELDLEEMSWIILSGAVQFSRNLGLHFPPLAPPSFCTKLPCPYHEHHHKVVDSQPKQSYCANHRQSELIVLDHKQADTTFVSAYITQKMDLPTWYLISRNFLYTNLTLNSAKMRTIEKRLYYRMVTFGRWTWWVERDGSPRWWPS